MTWGYGFDNNLPLTFLKIFFYVYFAAVYLNPDLRWPEDYLTRPSPWTQTLPNGYGCFLFVCWPLFKYTSYSNACDAHITNTLPIFDYIIIGAGAGGTTVMYRLANQHPTRNILFIEAGHLPSIASGSPKPMPYCQNTQFTWNHHSEISTTSGLAFKNGVSNICGKSYGGSTAVNAMMYVCGTDANYNKWATDTGDSSWNYASMLPYIKKNQEMTDGVLNTGVCASYHGTTGPVTLSDSGLTSLTDAVIPLLRASIASLNIRELTDINCGPYSATTGTPGYNGFANVRMTIKNGQRESAATAMMTKVGENVFTMVNSSAVKFNTKTDSTGVQITGVVVATLNSSCNPIVFKAKREIILSAGALSSPVIMQASGFGRPSDLNSCNIPVRKDLPVGEALSDHSVATVFAKIPGDANPLWDLVNTTAYLIGETVRYTGAVALGLPATGYFASMPGPHYSGFINTLDPSPSAYPDIQYICNRYDQYQPDFASLINDRYEYKSEIGNQIITANNNGGIIQCYVIVLQPKSRGTVKLRSCRSDPWESPVINGNYFTHPDDLATAIRGVRRIEEILTTPTMVNAGVTLLNIDIPECNPLPANSDALRTCRLKYLSQNMWHPTGTCKMGPANSPTSVVDPKLKVLGVSRGLDNKSPVLRIVDASIIPTITSGNTMCPVYALAEKAADMIIAANS